MRPEERRAKRRDVQENGEYEREYGDADKCCERGAQLIKKNAPSKDVEAAVG